MLWLPLIKKIRILFFSAALISERWFLKRTFGAFLCGLLPTTL
jgi:hypothetical protein